MPLAEAAAEKHGATIRIAEPSPDVIVIRAIKDGTQVCIECGVPIVPSTPPKTPDLPIGVVIIEVCDTCDVGPRLMVPSDSMVH